MTKDELLDEIQSFLGHVNWNSSGFCLRKAYVCALFSELTYHYIPEFEIENADRVNLIPSFAYQNIVRYGSEKSAFFADEKEKSMRTFTISNRYAVVLGTLTPDAIFIAIRGTKFLYDWFVNLKCTKFTAVGYRNRVKFHKGFYNAIFPCFGPIAREISRLHGGALPIYVTGHSLGGALAGIYHHEHADQYLMQGFENSKIRVNNAFTFGMPRFGNLAVMSGIQELYHIRNDLDIVPLTPPKCFGYENCINEFRLDGRIVHTHRDREKLNFVKYIWKLKLGGIVKNHAIELTRKEIYNNIR